MGSLLSSKPALVSGLEGCGVSTHSGKLIVPLGAVLEVASAATRARKVSQLFWSGEERVS